MNRFQFFEYIKNNLTVTAKEIAQPLIEDDLHKVDGWFENLAGIEWISIAPQKLDDTIGGTHIFLSNKYLFSYYNGKEIYVFDKTCPTCETLVHWLEYEKKLKCFNCEKSVTVKNGSGELKLKEYRTKCENGVWFIGIL